MATLIWAFSVECNLDLFCIPVIFSCSQVNLVDDSQSEDGAYDENISGTESQKLVLLTHWVC